MENKDQKPQDNEDKKPSQNASKGAEGGQDEAANVASASTMLELLGLKNQVRNAPKNEYELAQKQEWKFWNTQPVNPLDSKISKGINEPIEPNKRQEEIKQDPYGIPEGFHWVNLNLNSESELQELYTLLYENYVEDDDNMFRFDYSAKFLQWALQPPGHYSEWHVGVRVTKTKKLVGFISAVPAHMKVYDKDVPMVEINYLCVHKKLRSKRLAPVLIKEITRRVNLKGTFQAVYTAGVILPSPVAKCRYWHRSLNPKKLIEVGFSHLSRNMTMQRTIRLYKLPEQPKTPGFREFKLADSEQVFKLITNYLKNFDLVPLYTLEEFKHWFLPREGVIDAFVVEDDGGVITDFVSFYHLPSSIMNHPQYKTLKAAYSFYNVSTKTQLVDLMNDCLIMAKNKDLDVFNALDLMENAKFLEQLKFGIGDGNLQYYVYNWKCPPMESNKVGLVLQ